MPKPVYRKAEKGDRVFAGGRWTESQYKEFIRRTLRHGFLRYPVKQDALEAGSRPSQLKDKRTKKEYYCVTCKKWFKKSKVQLDHIKDCGNIEDLNQLVANLYCEEDGLQINCKGCHRIKTQLERESKRRNKLKTS